MMEYPVTDTLMPVFTFAEAYVPTGVPSRVTASDPSTPTSEPVPLRVADVPPLYARLVTLSPVTVSSFAVTAPVVSKFAML